MPNMDGTGPRDAGRRNGRGFWRYFANNRIGAGLGFGRGLGLCRFADPNNKDSLIAAKEALQARLNQVESLLKEE